MCWQIGTTVLTALTVLIWLPDLSAAQDGSASSSNAPDTAVRASPSHHDLVSREFLSRLFPIWGRMYKDRHESPVRGWKPAASRPIEQFQDKGFAQQTCWGICSNFLKDTRDLQKSGVAFVFVPSDDFDRQQWGGYENTQDYCGRHLLSFKRDDIYVTVVIQEDMIAFTYEYEVDPKLSEPPLPEVQKKLAIISPFLDDLVLEEFPPEEDFQGWAKVGLGKAKAKDPQRFNQDWVNAVRWWRKPGRFGVASTIHSPNMPTGRSYQAPYLDIDNKP